jgi:hypothetical protein
VETGSVDIGDHKVLIEFNLKDDDGNKRPPSDQERPFSRKAKEKEHGRGPRRTRVDDEWEIQSPPPPYLCHSIQRRCSTAPPRRRNIRLIPGRPPGLNFSRAGLNSPQIPSNSFRGHLLNSLWRRFSSHLRTESTRQSPRPARCRRTRSCKILSPSSRTLSTKRPCPVNRESESPVTGPESLGIARPKFIWFASSTLDVSNGPI